METASIEAFVTVAECSSFSAAAEILNLTQPAVSKRIAALESDIAEKLFDRLGRKVILTEAGLTLLPRCKLILNTINDSYLALQNLSGQVAGRLHIGTSHHIGLHRLPPILREYAQQYPDVKLDLNFMGSEQVCDAVIEGEMELGIITLPLNTPDKLAAKILWKDELIFVVGKDHSLANSKQIGLNQLISFDAILPERKTYTREIIEKKFAEKNLVLTTSLSTNYLETIKMMVSVGLGWSVLPKSMLDEDLRALTIKQVHLTRNLGVVQHTQRTLSNAAIAMTSLLTLMSQQSHKG